MDVQAEDQEVAPLVEAEEDQGEVAVVALQVVALQAVALQGLVQQEAVVEGAMGA